MSRQRFIIEFICVLSAVLAGFVPAETYADAPVALSVGHNLNVGQNLTIGMSKADVLEIIASIQKNQESAKLQQIAAESRLSKEAVRVVFLSVVGKSAEGLPIQEQVALILQSWVELKARLEHVSSDDAKVAELRKQALEALDHGNRADAERLLIEAKTAGFEAAKTAQQLANKRLRDAAETSVDLAKLSITDLRFAEAAQRYQEAAAIEPAADVEQRSRYLLSAGDAALEAGDFDGSTKYLNAGFALIETEGVRLILTRALIKHRLGRIALFEGKNNQAAELLADALTLERSAPNHDDTDEADILEDLSVTEWNSSKFKNAQADLELAEQLTKTGTSEHTLVVHSEALNTEGGLLGDLGDFKDAEKALLDAFELRKKIFSSQPLSPRLIDSENNLGYLYRQWNRPDDADVYLRKAEVAARAVYGGEHVTLSIILVNRAILECNLKKFDEATKVINEAQSIRHNRIGDNNLLTAYSLSVKGTILLHVPDIEGARSAITSAYQIRMTILQNPDETLARSHLALSALRRAEGNLGAAKTEAETALKTILGLFGPQHPLAGLAYRRLSEVLGALHSDPAAAKYNEQAGQVVFPNSECDL